jgi:hypothetical protein
MTRWWTLLRASLASGLVLLPGCEGAISEPGQGPGAGGRQSGQLLAPARAGFEAVANAMQPRCGTLDCHGQWGRNLRLFGGRGLRLDPKENAAEGTTTPEEFDATYWSVVALEPEILTAVVADHGARSERLTLIRKARNYEKHKGGTCMVVNDSLDRCVSSWLVGSIDAEACKLAAEFNRPGAMPPQP